MQRVNSHEELDAASLREHEEFTKAKNITTEIWRKCDLKHPPGDEIYQSSILSVFEIYGKKDRVYAQNLCYLAKLFLDQQTLYYGVDLFMFYIVCECDDRGTPHGWILFKAYKLSKKEGKVETPGRPLSDLGLVRYIAIKALSTLQSLELIQYRKGQHVNCAGRGGLDVDVSKMMWTT
ncbi:hypothetical protein F2Q69_00004843 [Brassica cretica]|uniref:MYST-type HAT domain-containing protein n=1 Tax=Brassica cretica TaxID=69181 RepID=A0A8S9NUE1_BRACR|nr:hypothetical protein F2Q69_00004843 [Brassica cretica]